MADSRFIFVRIREKLELFCLTLPFPILSQLSSDETNIPIVYLQTSSFQNKMVNVGRHINLQIGTI